MYGHVCVVCCPPEQNGASVRRLDVLGHQRMPPDKVQHIIRQRGGGVDASGPQSISYTLQEKKPSRGDDERVTRQDVGCRRTRETFLAHL